MRDQFAESLPPASGGWRREVAPVLGHFVAVGAFLAAMVDLTQRNWPRFAYLHREDGAVETLTCAFLFLSAATAHLLASGYRKAGRGKLAAVLWCGAVLFFAAGMEEISWAQRILTIKTPEALAAINQQRELNLHNIGAMHGTNEVRALLVLSAYGVVSGALATWVLRRRAAGGAPPAWVDAARLLTVPPRFAPYFLQMLIYVLMRRQDHAFLRALPEKRLIKELMEFVFALGCFLVLFYRLRTEAPTAPRAAPLVADPSHRTTGAPALNPSTPPSE
jgi:hypothetical protein